MDNRPSHTVSINDLSEEVILEIISRTDPEDWMRLGFVHHRLARLSSELWRTKFQSYFPTLFEKIKKQHIHKEVQWKKEFWYAHLIKKYYPKTYRILVKASEVINLEHTFKKQLSHLPYTLQRIITLIHNKQDEKLLNINFKAKDLYVLHDGKLMLERFGDPANYSQPVRDYFYNIILNGYEGYKGEDKEISEKTKDIRNKSLMIYAVAFNQVNKLPKFKTRETLLSIAANRGYLDMIGALLDRKISIKQVDEETGGTALHAAAHNGYLSILKLLRKRRKKSFQQIIDAVDKKGRTPLHRAASRGHLPVVKYLLKKGTNASLNHNGVIAIYLAMQKGHVNVAHYLLDFFEKEQIKIDLQFPHTHQFTLLHIAARNGYEQIALQLIEKNALVNAKSKSNYTPLHLAAKNGNVEIVKMLIKHNAALNELTNKYETALQLAAEAGHVDVVIELLKNKADINIKNTSVPLIDRAKKNVKPFLELVILLESLRLLPSDKKSMMFFGFSKSFTAAENIIAGNALKKVMFDNEDIATLNEHQEVLNGRELGGIYHQWLAINKVHADLNTLIDSVEKIENPYNHQVKLIFENLNKANEVRTKLLQQLEIRTIITEQQGRHCLILTATQYKNILSANNTPQIIQEHKPT